MIGFVILGAILRDVNLLILIAGTLLALLIVQWRIAIKTIFRLSLHRSFPRTMQARKPFDIELTITNPKTWLGAWWVNAEERICYEDLDPSEPGSQQLFQSINLLFTSVPPDSSRTLKYSCTAERRGRYHLLTTELTSRFPLGLLRSIARLSSNTSFLVHPANGTLAPGWKELFRGRKSGVYESSSRSLSDQGEFFGLRSYHPGDSPRWIHWRSTARRNELMVKQYQQSSSQELLLLVDLYREPKDDQEASSPRDNAPSPAKEFSKPPAEIQANDFLIEDECLEFAATIATYVSNSSSILLTLGLADSEPTVASKVQTRAQALAVLDRLAVARADSSGGEERTNSLASTLELLEREFRRVNNLVILSTRSQASAMQRELATPEGKRILPFWNQLTWIDACNGELSPYFKSTSLESSSGA